MRYFGFLFLLCFSPGAHAQIQISSLQSLLQYADQQSASALQARLQTSISQQDVNIQASGLYPRINVFASGDYYPIIATQVIPAEVLGGAPGTYLKAQFGLPYVFSTGVELSLPVINLEKWTQLQKAKAQYDQARWTSKAALENLHIQLAQSYYQYLVLREVCSLNAENTATADELMRVMDRRKENGILNPSDYHRAKNLQLDVAATSLNYQRALQQAANALNRLLGVDTLIVKDSVSGFQWEPLYSASPVEDRPAMMEAEARLAVAGLALRETKRGALPKLNLNGRYAYNLQSKLQQGSNDVTFDVSNINMRLDLPLFQGNYYRSARRKNGLLLQSARAEKEKVAAQIQEQERNWLQQYQTAFAKNSVLQGKLDNAMDNLRIARLSMNEDVMEFDEFNNIFLDYNRARMDYLQNLADGVLYYLLTTQKF